ncbi:helix-turn-helix domain-containing protein [Aliarcobacter butzleri]|uniref:helix-turn-helix domain-containing protein n=1 Tax=Aliarcobacter butzleri TaxID=28197 RepID=UPI000F4AA38E|nr:helix-turn-helix domain-containing protein [Aliarcobacter butzleri]MDK2050928.1 helix-turn-helix domain-containing protein [Aliarcobacter butzleri]
MSKLNFTDEQKELYSLIFKEYKKAQLSQKEASKILGVSIATLYRMREQGIGVGYKKLDSKSKNGTVVYPLQEIIKYLTESNIKTA